MQFPLYLTTETVLQQILCRVFGYVPGLRLQFINILLLFIIFFQKRKLLKCLPLYKCIASSSQIHLDLLIKLLQKSTNFHLTLPLKKLKPQEMWWKKRTSMSSSLQVPRERCTSCTPPVSLTVSSGSTPTYPIIKQ